MKKVILDSPEKHIARILLNRPDSNNAIDQETRELLIDLVADVKNDSRYRALILAGANGVLSAGGDLPSMQNLTFDQAEKRLGHGHEVCKALASIEIPVITAIETMGVGACVGLAMLSDYIVMGDSAFILLPFMKLGLVPDWGLMQTLPKRVGVGSARKIFTQCQKIPAAEALDIGLVDEIVENDKVQESAVEIANKFSRLPQHSFKLIKSHLQQNFASLDDALLDEKRAQSLCLTHPEFEEGFTALQEKRPADFIAASKSSDSL